MKKFVCCAIFATVLLLPCLVQAQEDIKGESSITTLDETVVTAGGLKKRKKKSPPISPL